jgi:desampylase
VIPAAPALVDAAMASLRLHHGQRAAIRGHAQRVYPEECCGILIGGNDGEAARVAEVVPAANVASERRHRFEIDPRALLAAHRRARERHQEVVGYYHSHPDAPARPSAHDLAHAWPGDRHLIVAIAGGAPGEIRAWRRTGDGFEPIVLERAEGLASDSGRAAS